MRTTKQLRNWIVSLCAYCYLVFHLVLSAECFCVLCSSYRTESNSNTTLPKQAYQPQKKLFARISKLIFNTKKI